MFAVLAGSRSGSHLLKTLLDSHPDLTCYDEILGLRKDEKDFYDLGQHEGCLVNYENLIEGETLAKGNDVPRLLDIMRKVPVIHLTRSLSESAKSQLFYARAKRANPMAFRKANLETDREFALHLASYTDIELENVRTRLHWLKNNCLKQFNKDIRDNWLDISYNWLCGDKELKTLPREKSEKLCRYLQVPVTKLHTNLYKIRKFSDTI